jgi:hypothetical protein
MTLKRMDNVGVVVDELAAAVAFFKELGLELPRNVSPSTAHESICAIRGGSSPGRACCLTSRSWYTSSSIVALALERSRPSTDPSTFNRLRKQPLSAARNDEHLGQ